MNKITPKEAPPASTVSNTAVVGASASTAAVAAKTKLEEDLRKSAPRVMKHMNDDHRDSLVAYVLAFATGVENEVSDSNSNLDWDPETEKMRAALLRNIKRGRLRITSALLTGLDTEGFLLLVKASDPEEEDDDENTTTDGDSDDDIEKQASIVLANVRVPYEWDQPITSARDLHSIAVGMHQKAHDKLGIWYKARHGYYAKAIKGRAQTTYKALSKQAATRAKRATKQEAAIVATAIVVVALGTVVWHKGGESSSGRGATGIVEE
mmetsp:Transcript_26937/g.57695  ORF Transcript_26937/g.57695 Transcript_26937/m.57695 type:complete len:266 (+) Transcript_26937:40-837(+)|eukprot:CAMPEP_0201219454 /NCGR_PEP_ID=MMETSP0851-20130426/191086_1 /ASSEMBLY_ACC=CAM_ASM_000631 /TAXON_ID=183588 /ORGANISM="Pseudo-nitzschia fraudulenta, Strain WWA7" /LENGTH=265 /DNA_ID=CAMNT_0047509143 /DNA_START=71 /DNA_END=868 /DNA_ORIENTATION=+